VNCNLPSQKPLRCRYKRAWEQTNERDYLPGWSGRDRDGDSFVHRPSLNFSNTEGYHMTSTTIIAAPDTDVAARPPRFKYLEWGPVIAGAIGAAAISLVLFTFGSAIGLSVVSPWPNHGMSTTTFMVIAALFAAVVQVGSFAAGGYLAGRMRSPWLSGVESERHFRDGSYGFAVWALGLLIGATIAVSGATGVLKTTAQSTAITAGTGVAGTANRVTTDPSDYAIDLLMRPAPTTVAAPNPAPADATAATRPDMAGRADSERDLRAPLTRIFVSSLQSGSLAANDRTYLAQVVARQTGLSQADAEARVDQAYAEAKSAEAKVRAAADKARKLGMIAAFLAAATLAIGCAAACAGASAGGRARDEQIPARFLGAARFW
jgi:hypothetical protein